MTGSIALDVVIGLVFIYSLYSLLTTTVVEMIASVIRLRSYFLEWGIQRMLDDGSGTKIFSTSFYEQPVIKYLSSGWVTKKPSYLSAQNFSKALIELLKKEGTALLKTQAAAPGAPVYAAPPTELDKLLAGLTKKTNENKPSETVEFMESLLRDAQNDIEKFRGLLEQWYDDTQERVSSWYKKWIQVITLVVGLVIAASFDVDTIDIVQQLSDDPALRAQYVSMAQKLADDKDFARQVYPDSSARQAELAELRKTYDAVKKRAAEASNALVSNVPKSSHYGVGIVLTAIALSLGAPFWFDLLNKVVRLRSSVPTGAGSSTAGNAARAPGKKDQTVG